MATSHAHNTYGLRGGVHSVDYAYGATVVRTRKAGWGAVTQGSFIVGSNNIRADANNPLFQHEYGHYLQSQSMGWAYYPRVGIPSIRSARGDNHDFHPIEQDANRRAFLYFNENVEGFYVTRENANQGMGWNFRRNPLDISGEGIRGQYVDYQDQDMVNALSILRVRSRWYDHASWLFLPSLGPIWIGLYN